MGMAETGSHLDEGNLSHLDEDGRPDHAQGHRRAPAHPGPVVRRALRRPEAHQPGGGQPAAASGVRDELSGDSGSYPMPVATGCAISGSSPAAPADIRSTFSETTVEVVAGCKEVWSYFGCVCPGSSPTRCRPSSTPRSMSRRASTLFSSNTPSLGLRH
jgi:hypothetical protein